MSDKPARKHLIIDAQLLQTSDRSRGTGLYLIGLLKNLPRLHEYELSIVVNNRLPALSEQDAALIHALQGNFLNTSLLHRGDNEEFMYSVDANRTAVTELLRNRFNETDLSQVTYFIPALFSSEIHPVFPEGTTNILLFHDLIPFLYYRNYFADHEGVPRKDYAQRFREVYRTDLFVTNSQTTADDLTVYLGVDSSRIVPIFGAAADRTKVKPSEPSFADELKGGFVFMPSGDDFRKNNSRAVQAFAATNSNIKLVITSNFSEGTKRELQTLCPDVYFAGSVSDAEFLWLLDAARLVFFPPEYEGLGMPLIEAAERKAPIVCSNIPVFAEISQDAFSFFDPYSVTSMTDALKTALATSKSAYIKNVSSSYKRVIETFTWKRTAELFVEALHQAQTAPAKKRMAIFCPSPSSYSAVGKYAFEVHAELSRLFEIDYYAEDGLTVFEPTRPNILEYATNYYPASSFSVEKAKSYDHILYNLGNSEFHLDTILNALRLPANATIHDTRLNGIFDWLERNSFLTAERRELEARLDEVFKAKDTDCLVSLVTNQKTAFCHSAFAYKAIRHLIDADAPHLVQTVHPIGVPAIELRRLGKPMVSFAGIISEDKGISIVADIAKNKDVDVKIFGFGVLGDSPLLEGLGDNVSIMKDLTDKDFQTTLQQSSILVNYRPNYHGETSRSTLEAMRHGVVVIVKNVGWYGELPDDVVVKVENEHDVVPAINGLLADPAAAKKIAENARKFLSKNYTYKAYAEKLAENLL